MRHPDDFFQRSHEAVTIDPLNKSILKAHLICASSEISLRADDSVYDTNSLRHVIDGLVDEKVFKPVKSNTVWFTHLRFPQRDVSIRGAGEVFSVFSESGRIAEISGVRIFREAHPDAIYLHKGRQYRVEEFDLEERKVFCRGVDVPYYTQAISHEETEIICELEKREQLSWGNLKITHTVTGFWKKRLLSQEKVDSYPLDLPSWTFETQGLWITLEAGLEEKVVKEGLDFTGGIHAFEHAAISALPLFAMCEKADIGGIGYPLYPDFGVPAIFIYDGCEGGVGLTRRGVEVFNKWIEATEKIITECNCEEGCPSCVQDPQCGSGNEPLDKRAALLILGEIRGSK
jgi:DEAD/DEAH box helicase domain-containing protein